MLIILFGLAGSGKNYVGDIIAKNFDFYFWDADLALPQDMKQAIHDKKPFTQSQRDHFTQIIIQNISDLRLKHKNLVVAQALYKEQNRETISKAYPEAHLLQIKANTKNLESHLKLHTGIDTEYAHRIEHNFQEPKLLHGVILNDADEQAVVKQIQLWLSQNQSNKP